MVQELFSLILCAEAGNGFEEPLHKGLYEDCGDQSLSSLLNIPGVLEKVMY